MQVLDKQHISRSCTKVVVLTRVMHQAGQDTDQVRFRNILICLRNAEVTLDNWEHLRTRTTMNVQTWKPL